MPKAQVNGSATTNPSKNNGGGILKRNQVILVEPALGCFLKATGGLPSVQKTEIEMVLDVTSVMPNVTPAKQAPLTVMQNDLARLVFVRIPMHSHMLNKVPIYRRILSVHLMTSPTLAVPIPASTSRKINASVYRVAFLEVLLKEKQEVISSLVGSSVEPSQYTISSGLEGPHDLSPAALTPASKNFDTSSAVGYTDSFIHGNSSSVFGMFEEDFAGGIPIQLDVLWPGWPQYLPRPDLLRHIVDAFFAFHPHATRLLNMSTFLTALSLPSDHPNFPSPAVLHAICAAGSLYTVANKQQFGSSALDFAEQQVIHAKNQIDRHLISGQKPLECLQATIVLSWYYWGHARWIELFVSTGQSLRIAVPLGLNLCPPFHALNTTAKSMSIMPAPPTFVEEEARRNVFWLAYAIDRQYGAGNGWAMSLDDNDIAQLLPLPKAKLDARMTISSEHRQWSHLYESLLVHPPDLTDSFTLYIKAMMIISRIKNFNHRFRAMENNGDPGSKSTRTNRWSESDIRSTVTFNQLDGLLVSFRSSLSHEFKDPFVNNCIDPHLYTTHLALHASIILLHEPHSVVQKSICTSAMKILHAARGILELVYAVLSTNYAIGLLDPFCPFCWFLAGRVFGRFLKAALDASSIQQIKTLQAELEFIRVALGKMGESVPLSARYQKMLDAYTLEACGPTVLAAVPVVYGEPVRTVVDDFLLSRVTQTQIPAYDLGAFMKLYNGFVEGP